MRLALPLIAVFALVGIPARAESPARSPGAAALERAIALLEVPNFQGARAALRQALEAKGNDRATLLQALELEGVVDASMRDTAGALAAFQKLLALDPGYQPTRDYSPRVMGPFLEAKAWLADNPPLRFAPLPPETEKGAVKRISAAVLSDPLEMSRAVRFHLRSNGGWAEERVRLEKARASASAPPGLDAWFAELLGEDDAVLSSVGTAQNPIAVGSAPALALPRIELRGQHYWALGLGGGALVSLGAGALFGLASEDGWTRLRTATRNQGGVITGMTQRDAFAVEQWARADAAIANSLFVASAALAAGAGAVLWLGGRAQVAPAPGGLAFRGTFP